MADNYGNVTNYSITKIKDVPHIQDGQYEMYEKHAADVSQFTLTERLCNKLADWNFDNITEENLQSTILNAANFHNINLSYVTLNRWFNGHSDPSINCTQDTRENIYKLCAALDLNYQATESIFLKVFFIRPFNLKHRNELAYYYFARKYNSGKNAITNNWYNQALNFINKLTHDDFSANTVTPARNTINIINALSSIDTEEQLADYIKKNIPASFEAYYGQTARQHIKNIFPQCQKNAATELDYYKIDAEQAEALPASKPSTAEALINIITWYNPRHRISFPKLITLPAAVRTNFPTGKTLSEILSGNEVSLDKMKKMLIILLFYDYFAEEHNKHLNPDEKIILSEKDKQIRFDSFLNELNEYLEQSGFLYLYPGNPFDYLFMYCAATIEPLTTFRLIINNAVEKA